MTNKVAVDAHLMVTRGDGQMSVLHRVEALTIMCSQRTWQYLTMNISERDNLKGGKGQADQAHNLILTRMQLVKDFFS